MKRKATFFFIVMIMRLSTLTWISAYMDKLHESGRAIVIDPTNPESEAKAISAIQQKLDLHPQG
jgi:hypothetical protein